METSSTTKGAPLFLAVLSNASIDVVGLTLGVLTVQRRPRSQLVRLINELHDFPEDFALFLEDHYQCTDPSGRYVYTIEGPAPQVNEAIAARDAMALHDAQESFIKDLEQRVKLLRLFGEGLLIIPMWFFYDPTNSNPNFYSIGYDYVKPTSYTLDSESAGHLEPALAKGDLTTSHAYIRLAWDALDESYDQRSQKLELLSLMMAIEVLFNDGQGELRFRIARAVAVLLGRNVKMSQQIFTTMKTLYDKRSLVVHTGQCKSLSKGEIVQLRYFARRAIILLAHIDADKGKVSDILTQSGFGTSRSAIGRMRS